MTYLKIRFKQSCGERVTTEEFISASLDVLNAELMVYSAGTSQITSTITVGEGEAAVTSSITRTVEADVSTEIITNSRGVSYPKVIVEGFGEIPFPEEPFTPNNSQVLRSQFTPKLKTEFKDWWVQQNRPWPTVPEGSSLNIHHIKPLSHGGTNAFENLVTVTQSA